MLINFCHTSLSCHTETLHSKSEVFINLKCKFAPLKRGFSLVSLTQNDKFFVILSTAKYPFIKLDFMINKNQTNTFYKRCLNFKTRSSNSQNFKKHTKFKS